MSECLTTAIGSGLQRVASRGARFLASHPPARPTSTKSADVIRLTSIRFVPIEIRVFTASMMAFRSGNRLDLFQHGHHASQPYKHCERRGVVRQ